MSDPLLLAQDLSLSFGGLHAVSNLNLEVQMGEVHAIIGPNGAGKTSLINLFSGDIEPTRGRVYHRGEDITGLPPYQVVARGIGRSYQITNIFLEFTCSQNCWLAARARLGSAMRFFVPSGRDIDTANRVSEALSLAGLEDKANHVAKELSYGEQRQLEIAMLMALEPEILLLDEPLAGLGVDESQGVLDLVRRLAPEHGIVLIEHDMDAVFAIADKLTVMVDGQVLESGTPDIIKVSEKVRKAYLGDD